MPTIEAASFKKSDSYQWRSRGEGGILDKLYVIICLNYFDQLLLGYIAYLLIVKSSYCVAQCTGANIKLRKWAQTSRLRFGVFPQV